MLPAKRPSRWSHSRVPRWRQTLWNARAPPSAVADDEHAGAGDVAPDEPAARFDLFDAAHGEPHAGKDPLHLVRRTSRRPCKPWMAGCVVPVNP